MQQKMPHIRICLAVGIFLLCITAVSPKRPKAINCNRAIQKYKFEGTYRIGLPKRYGVQPFTVNCIKDLEGNVWTVFLRRQDGSVNFNQTWSTYREGFGDPDGEYFIGLAALFALTLHRHNMLWIKLIDFDNNARNAYYERFAINNGKGHYALHVLGKYSGDAGDALTMHYEQPFATIDRPGNLTVCSPNEGGGWWYKSCFYSHLTSTLGVQWSHFNSTNGIKDKKLRYAHMAIRPRCS